MGICVEFDNKLSAVSTIHEPGFPGELLHAIIPKGLREVLHYGEITFPACGITVPGVTQSIFILLRPAEKGCKCIKNKDDHKVHTPFGCLMRRPGVRK